MKYFIHLASILLATLCSKAVLGQQAGTMQPLDLAPAVDVDLGCE